MDVTTDEIVDNNTHALEITGTGETIETDDNRSLNLDTYNMERSFSFWVRPNVIQRPLGVIFKEGGGIQNYAFLMGYGGVLLYQIADTPGRSGNCQAWSDFRLEEGRKYHIFGSHSLTGDDAGLREHRLWIDGVKQTDSSGNPMDSVDLTNFDSHSGDLAWGEPIVNLETGGTDIAYNGMEDTDISDFAIWTDNSGTPWRGYVKQEGITMLYRRGR